MAISFPVRVAEFFMKRQGGQAATPQPVPQRGAVGSSSAVVQRLLLELTQVVKQPSVPRRILILGVARSGTSWLGKIFDSHPNVIYRNEPDFHLPTTELPYFCNSTDFPRFARAATEYLSRLSEIRTTKTVGVFPIFRKNYRSTSAHLMRLLCVLSFRLPELSWRGSRFVRNLQIPAFIDAKDLPSIPVVIKSVSQLGRAGLFTRMVSGIRTILIIRDPWNQIASQIRGLRMHKFERDVIDPSITETEQAQRRNLTRDQFLQMPLPEQLAWQWLLFNEKAMEDLADCRNSRIVLHRELTLAPEQTARSIFAFADLPWSEQTQRFLYDSQNRAGGYRYFSVYRSSQTLGGPQPWQAIINKQEAERVRAIVADSVPGKLFV